MSSFGFRRLAADHAALHKQELPPYYLFPATSAGAAMPDDLTTLNILLAGPAGTPYEDGLWKLQLKMPQDYPKSPPKAYFKTKIFHPNVEEANGSVCLDTLKRDWESNLTLRDILITISCLLINPNPDSALNSTAGKLLQEDWSGFTKHAKVMTSIHARVPAPLRDLVAQARSRGEEKTKDAQSQIHEDESDEEMEDNNQENDPSLSPSPVEPSPATSIRRNTILGKRPLADLPPPPEPPSDDEDDDNINGNTNYLLSASDRNIAANTPNLSSNMATMSVSSSSAFDYHPIPDLSAPLLRRPAAAAHTPSLCTDFHHSDASAHAAAPAAKRLCPSEGKENQADPLALLAGGLRAFSAQQPKPTPMLGLALKPGASAGGGAGSLPTSRKVSAASVGSAKGKARVGMRRL